jgi:two-component system, OmpR family, sensor histidine kinase YxdK
MAGIKLFLKEHYAFIIFQMIVVLFFLTIFWLEGFRDLNTAVYVFTISCFLVGAFLIVRYMLRRKFYQKILTPPNSMDAALNRSAKTMENEVVENYMHELYRNYQNEVQTLYATQDRQSKFMNQWIHQMKTPISVLELLLQEEELDKTSVQEEIDRLKRGLDLVLMNARLENFENDLQIEQVNLKEIMTSVINENKRLFITNRVYPQVQIDDELIVMSDPKWLKFVLNQFITNAVKYTFEPNKKITLQTEQDEYDIILNVIDEGIGIPKSDLSRVTKAFFTGENGRKSGESTGMGLYLAQEICGKLGHPLSIQSQVGQGTTVQMAFKRSDS